MMLGPVEGPFRGRRSRPLRRIPVRPAPLSNPATDIGDGCPAPA